MAAACTTGCQPNLFMCASWLSSYFFVLKIFQVKIFHPSSPMNGLDSELSLRVRRMPLWSGDSFWWQHRALTASEQLLFLCFEGQCFSKWSERINHEVQLGRCMIWPQFGYYHTPILVPEFFFEIFWYLTCSTKCSQIIVLCCLYVSGNFSFPVHPLCSLKTVRDILQYHRFTRSHNICIAHSSW